MNEFKALVKLLNLPDEFRRLVKMKDFNSVESLLGEENKMILIFKKFGERVFAYELDMEDLSIETTQVLAYAVRRLNGNL